jgi:hypothetical protein
MESYSGVERMQCCLWLNESRSCTAEQRQFRTMYRKILPEVYGPLLFAEHTVTGITYQVKGKAVSQHTYRRRGKGCIAPTHSRPGWEVNVTPQLRFTPGERNPGTYWTGGWVGPRAGLHTEVRGRIVLPLHGIQPRSSRRPVRSQTLYWLSYPGSLKIIWWHNCSKLWPGTLFFIKTAQSTPPSRSYHACLSRGTCFNWTRVTNNVATTVARH